MRLIDADALPKYTGYALSANEVAKAVENAPTIDAEPVRRGHWELIDEADPICWGCSKCFMYVGYKTNYCPFCGAKMEEQE